MKQEPRITNWIKQLPPIRLWNLNSDGTIHKIPVEIKQHNGELITLDLELERDIITGRIKLGEIDENFTYNE